MTASGTSTGFDVVLTTPRAGTTLVAVTGDLDAYSVAMLRSALEHFPAGDDAVLDLSGVPFIDSAGLGALVAAVRRVRHHGGNVAVVSSRISVVRMLRVTGFDRIAPVHESLGAALAE